jgi:hypothetical protein
MIQVSIPCSKEKKILLLLSPLLMLMLSLLLLSLLLLLLLLIVVVVYLSNLTFPPDVRSGISKRRDGRLKNKLLVSVLFSLM